MSLLIPNSVAPIKTKTSIAILVISLGVLSLLIPTKFENINHELNLLCSIIVVANVLVFFRYQYAVYKSWVRFDTLFLLGYLIVHFQIPFLASIGIEPERPDFIWVNIMVVNYATWLSAIGILVWMFGTMMFRKKSRPIDHISFKVQTKNLDILLLMLFPAFIFLVGSDFLGGEYDGISNWGAGATYVFLLLRAVLYLQIIYFFMNTREEKFSIKNLPSILFKNPIVFVVGVLYTLLFLFVGDRGPVMQIVLIVMGSYAIFQKDIGLLRLLLIATVGAVVFFLIGLGRGENLSDDSNVVSKGLDIYQTDEIQFNPTYELSTSNRILFRAIDVVPESHPYLYGNTFVMEIMNLIPFGSSTYMEITNIPDLYRSTSYFFTIMGQGEFYTYGEGSEIIGDIYINFGIIGVIIMMFLFGYGNGYITWKLQFTRKQYVYVIYLLAISSAIYINRSHLLEPFKLIVYGLLIDKFLTKKIAAE